MTSKIRVEEIVDLIDFLCICGFPEEFEIMGRLIVDKLSYVSDFSMDNGKAKEWSGRCFPNSFWSSRMLSSLSRC